MNQIITQHGWGLDQSFWDSYKVEFLKNGWYWQNNERGYFSKNIIAATTSNDILLFDYFEFDTNDFKSLLDGS